jgi:putative glutamine amidotransferase
MRMIESDAGRRPVIGIPVGRDVPAGPEYLRIRGTYSAALAAAGGVPLLIPPLADAAALRQIFELLDGVVFPGGLDVEPGHFGEEQHITTQSDEVLDELELRLAGWAVDEELPTLGLCRGQQLLNVALGGSLIQDLRSEGLEHPQSPHHGPRSEVVHRLDVAPESRLAEVFGVTSFAVNSYHHQAVRRLGRGLRAVAWSPDGVIEGVESLEHPWLLAVQFHPEDLVDVHQPSRRLFRAFVGACEGRTVRGAVGVA